MRKYKFRGRLKKPVTLLDGSVKTWEYGLLNYDPIKRVYMINGNKIDYKTVGQYTELNDSNGIEIYEGDILEERTFDDDGEDFTFTTVMRFDKNIEITDQEPTISNGYTSLTIDSGDTKTFVIGNVYDNPEIEIDYDSYEE